MKGGGREGGIGCIKQHSLCTNNIMSWFGLAVRHYILSYICIYAGKQKGVGLIPLWTSLLFKKVVVRS